MKSEDGNGLIQAPDERKSPGKCWKLKKWLYVMRPAARAWEATKLEPLGTSRGKVAPTCFDDGASPWPMVATSSWQAHGKASRR